MPALPDLATQTPLWLSVAAVAVNALVGALHGMDSSHHWDIVGVSVFALLMPSTAALLVAHYVAWRLGLRTRPAAALRRRQVR